MRIGLIGCGNIGKNLLASAEGHEFLVYDIDPGRTSEFAEAFGAEAADFRGIFERADLVIEAAHPSVVPEVLREAIRSGTDVMIMSTGGIIGSEDLYKKAGRKINIYLPSGAIAGTDAVMAASRGKISSVTITTTKPPAGLAGAPYITENNICLDLKEKAVIFDGSVGDAIKGFPKNINVSATLMLLSGYGDVRVRIVADPDTKSNTHEIEVVGEFGRIHTRSENVPSPDNPKTSYLAVLSAVSVLSQILKTKR
ncbi:MAG: aspartate dehydrogenase domain-containing protein [archaeon]